VLVLVFVVFVAEFVGASLVGWRMSGFSSGVVCSSFCVQFAPLPAEHLGLRIEEIDCGIEHSEILIVGWTMQRVFGLFRSFAEYTNACHGCLSVIPDFVTTQAWDAESAGQVQAKEVVVVEYVRLFPSISPNTPQACRQSVKKYTDIATRPVFEAESAGWVQVEDVDCALIDVDSLVGVFFHMFPMVGRWDAEFHYIFFLALLWGIIY